MTALDASPVIGTLFIGSFPAPRKSIQDEVDAIVLCAAERQPLAEAYPGVKVLHCPLYDDIAPLTPEECAMVQKTVRKIRILLDEGKTVLVTCFAGLNRSGFIAAMSLLCPRNINNRVLNVGVTPGCMLATEAIRLVRKARGIHALANPKFTYILAECEHPCAYALANKSRLVT